MLKYLLTALVLYLAYRALVGRPIELPKRFSPGAPPRQQQNNPSQATRSTHDDEYIDYEEIK